MKIYKLFLIMAKMEKGSLIDNPRRLVLSDFILPLSIRKILATQAKRVYFTRLSIKHIAEKGEMGLHILQNINRILNNPDRIHLSKISNRFLISKQITFSSNEKAHGVVIELIENKKNVIVTGFIAKEAYFKNLKLLWGATYSPSQQPPKK
jgi:hypothetical protein